MISMDFISNHDLISNSSMAYILMFNLSKPV